MDTSLRAQDVVFKGFERAHAEHESYVSTQHLLFGLLRIEDKVTNQILERMSISPAEVIIELEQQLVSGIMRLIIQLTPRAIYILMRAEHEAHLLGHETVEPAHILLALLEEGQGLAARILDKRGADIERMRGLVKEYLNGA